VNLMGHPSRADFGGHLRMTSLYLAVGTSP
jgi:hypothetical protein